MKLKQQQKLINLFFKIESNYNNLTFYLSNEHKLL
jgi:hypothetical protein